MIRAVPLSESRTQATEEPRRYHGACACGSVRFVVNTDGESAVRCICPRCRGLDLRIMTLPRGRFRLLTGHDALTEPLKAARTPHHFFCARCGEPSFGYPDGPDGRLVSVSAALLERGDPDDIEGGVSIPSHPEK